MTGLCAVPPSLPADPEGAKAPLPSAGALLRRRSTSPASGSCSSATASTAASVPTTSTGSSPTSAPTRRRRRRPGGERRLRRRARRIGDRRSAAELVAALRRQQVAVLRRARARPAHVPPQHEPAALQEQPEAAAGGQLRRRPQGARARGRASARRRPPTSTCCPSRPATETSASTRSRAPTCARRAALAKGHTRGGKAVLYTHDLHCVDVAQAQILQRNLKAIGLEVEIKQFPRPLSSRSWRRPASRSTSAASGWFVDRDPGVPRLLFDGRTIGQPGIRQLVVLQLAEVQPAARPRRRASPGPRATAPTASSTCSSRGTPRRRFPSRASTRSTFVSARVGCVVLNPALDLTAVCLK